LTRLDHDSTPRTPCHRRISRPAANDRTGDRFRSSYHNSLIRPVSRPRRPQAAPIGQLAALPIDEPKVTPSSAKNERRYAARRQSQIPTGRPQAATPRAACYDLDKAHWRSVAEPTTIDCPPAKRSLRGDADAGKPPCDRLISRCRRAALYSPPPLGRAALEAGHMEAELGEQPTATDPTPAGGASPTAPAKPDSGPGVSPLDCSDAINWPAHGGVGRRAIAMAARVPLPGGSRHQPVPPVDPAPFRGIGGPMPSVAHSPAVKIPWPTTSCFHSGCVGGLDGPGPDRCP